MNPRDEIKKHIRVTKAQTEALKRIGLLTIQDLLFYFPSRYADAGESRSIIDIAEGEKVILTGELANLKKEISWKSRIPMSTAKLRDTTGSIDIIWLHQPYIAKMLPEGEPITVTGTISSRNGKKMMLNPDILKTGTMSDGASLFNTNQENVKELPVYPETRGLNAKWFYYAIEKIIASGAHKAIPDVLSAELLDRYHLPKLETALLWMHMPRKKDDAAAARKRFAFEEIFLIEIERLLARDAYQAHGAYPIKKDVQEFLDTLPFALTKSQEMVLGDIATDCQKNIPMTRLLEGDVGSGKTAIAAAIAYATVMTSSPEKKNEYLQALYMAPTEILANQHFESFCSMFKPFGKTIGLITSSGCKKFPAKSISMKRADIEWTPVSRTQLLKWAKDGTIDILIGTHSLMQKTVVMRHFALAIIDEQHRFGAKQRRALISKDGPAPHLLSMTATPIPRTLALTIFGDLDLSLLLDMPPGRKPVITKFITRSERDAMYTHAKEELQKGRQLYVICPRIDPGEDDGSGAILKQPSKNLKFGGGKRSVTEEAKRLQAKEFKGYRVGVLHGKLKPAEKEDIMEKYLRHEIDVLVATSVIEVGVNVPNASVIIIEEAERFGAAQLHQLRGRVIRGVHQSYCYLLSETESEKSGKRLTALVETKNGFELAEADMMERGPGHFAGVKQSGMSDLAMEALKNIRLVEAAKKEARLLLEDNKELTRNSLLKERLLLREKTIHFE